MMQPVYVVGYGSIDGLGNNPKDSFSNFLNDVDYTTDISFLTERNEKIYKGITVDYGSLQLPDIDKKVLKSFTYSQLLSFHVVEQALKMSELDLSPNVAVIFSSAANTYESLGTYIPHLIDGKRINPRRLVNCISDMIPSHICGHYGFMGASVSMMASCATSLYTIDYASRLCDEYDYVIVGSGDSNVFLERMLYFQAIGALGNKNCPFDDDREGFVMGEGAGCLILQSSKKVKEYNSDVHATLYPCGCASDALDMTSPAQDARGAKIAIKNALKNVSINDSTPLMIDAVSAHATSTIIGDPIEYIAVTDILDKVPMYAPKSKVGHTIGASGVLETIYAIESMKNQVIPGIQNFTKCSFDTKECLVKDPISLPNKTLKTLNNSFAFGGKCISQVIEV
jgi:3-oxoacyl-[acyl-carrier-protein] synthase II